MRFLSLSNPWPWAIFDMKPQFDLGGIRLEPKRTENRNWPPPFTVIGKRIALQASKSWDEEAAGFFLKLGIADAPARRDMYPTGVILGFATIAGMVTSSRPLAPVQAPWFMGRYGWVLEDVLKLPSPIKCKGVLGLRELWPDVNEQAMAAISALWPDKVGA